MSAGKTELRPREVEAEDDAIPPIEERLAGVLLSPVATFRALEPRWGWAGPWLAVAAAGLFAAILVILRTDLLAVEVARASYQTQLLPSQERRELAKLPASDTDKGPRARAFLRKLGLVLGPTVFSLLGIVATGAFLFVIAGAWKGRAEFLRAVAVAAHAKLVAVVGAGVVACGALLGNPSPRTSLANAADELVHPLGSAALGLLDPIDVWHTALLGVGLVVALEVRRRPAVLAVLFLHFLANAPALIGAVAATTMRSAS